AQRRGLNFSSRLNSRITGELLAEVPRQPLRRRADHLLSSLLKRVEIVERVDIAQPAGVDQAHVDVADLRPPEGLVEEGAFAMNDRALEDLFTQIVVEGRADLAQEQRELAPVLCQVVQRLAQPRVGFDLLAVDLP